MKRINFYGVRISSVIAESNCPKCGEPDVCDIDNVDADFDEECVFRGRVGFFCEQCSHEWVESYIVKGEEERRKPISG